MCTVTIVPAAGGFRLSCNRDERRDRAAALPPAAHRLGRRTAVFPIDPVGPGTWVGVNDSGLAAALLNRTGRAVVSSRRPRRSRGHVLPLLLASASLHEALERSQSLDPSAFDPCRVVLAGEDEIAVVTMDGTACSVARTALTRPMMFTSSALGDRLAERARRRVFNRFFAGPCPSWLDAQRRFHLHRWPYRPELGVLMERADAKTVSRAIIDVTQDCIDLTYCDLGS